MKISSLVPAIIVGSSLHVGSVFGTENEDDNKAMLRVKIPVNEDRNLLELEAAGGAGAECRWEREGWFIVTWFCRGDCVVNGKPGACVAEDTNPDGSYKKWGNPTRVTPCDCNAKPPKGPVQPGLPGNPEKAEVQIPWDTP